MDLSLLHGFAMRREWIEVGGLVLEDQGIVTSDVDKDSEAMCRCRHHVHGARIDTKPTKKTARKCKYSPWLAGADVVDD